MFGNYSKFVGAILGNGVGLAVVYLATKGVAVCVPPEPMPAIEQSCTLFGFTTAQITGTVLAIANTAFVYCFPPNVDAKAAPK